MQKGLCMREKAETVGVKITRLNFLGFFGCGSPTRDQIHTPALEAEFYPGDHHGSSIF